jgi:hypothetical protein
MKMDLDYNILYHFVIYFKGNFPKIAIMRINSESAEKMLSIRMVHVTNMGHKKYRK